MYKLDAGSQPACNAHRDHHSGSVRNARQEPATSENSWRIGALLVSPRTYAPKRYEPLRADHGCAQDSKRGPKGAGHHERMPVTPGWLSQATRWQSELVVCAPTKKPESNGRRPNFANQLCECIGNPS